MKTGDSYSYFVSEFVTKPFIIFLTHVISTNTSTSQFESCLLKSGSNFWDTEILEHTASTGKNAELTEGNIDSSQCF